jgi:site-specific DNA-methyltransferase (adenine-specific)
MAGAIMTAAKDSWNTPDELLEPVREFFKGQIGLDPCWNASSITEPKLKFCLDEGQDGLQLGWGRTTVFVNPPWGKVISLWVQKAVAESEENGAGVIMLLPANTDTKAWQNFVFPHAEAICFLRGRVTFLDPDTGMPAKQGVTKGASFVYFGRRSYKEFRDVFGSLGHVIGRVVPTSTQQ